MRPVPILHKKQFSLTIQRLCHELIENHDNFSESVIIGLQPRGIYLANRLKSLFEKILPNNPIDCGSLDITFYRDDFRRRDELLLPKITDLDFIIENKKVILVDDVLYTGRTVRSGLDAMLAYGRPKSVELLVLVDRRFRRQLPIQAQYVGKYVDSLSTERVSVEWKEIEGEDSVILYTPTKENE